MPNFPDFFDSSSDYSFKNYLLHIRTEGDSLGNNIKTYLNQYKNVLSSTMESDIIDMQRSKLHEAFKKAKALSFIKPAFCTLFSNFPLSIENQRK
jgi:t-SNARE complex subunit (syntaxin)